MKFPFADYVYDQEIEFKARRNAYLAMLKPDFRQAYNMATEEQVAELKGASAEEIRNWSRNILGKSTIMELREQAKHLRIVDWSRKTKDELIQAIKGHNERGRGNYQVAGNGNPTL